MGREWRFDDRIKEYPRRQCSHMITDIVFYAVALSLLALSFFTDKAKTVQALRKAWKSFEGILPQFLGIIVLIGILLAVFDPKAIQALIGSSSGWWGTLLASAIGSITLIPGIIAFPTAAMLLKGGAGYMQIAAFISTLMMVGVITLPAEISTFNGKVALLRNGLAYLFSLVVALIVGIVMSL
jgi:uncharacterized membrane protein YraQ (UPF0718 family)